MTVNPAEVVAVGAATQAAIIKGEIKALLLLDATPLSLGVETLGGMVTKVIERSTTIPVRRTEVFSTAEDNESAVDIIVLQGERERAAERAGLAAAWLAVVDHLELALRHADEDATALGAGVRAVHEQVVATLARLGFPRLDAESPPGTVIRGGYGTSEAPLRPAGVVVARQ